MTNRRKHTRAAPYHRWTEDELNYIRVHFRHDNQSRAEIAAHLGVSFGAVSGQISAMGLSKSTNRRQWTPQEDARLEVLMQQHPPSVVAKRLKRSVNAVVVRSKRLGVYRLVRDGWYCVSDVAAITGMTLTAIRAVIREGKLPAYWHHSGERVVKKDEWHSMGGANVIHITEKDLRIFLRQYPEVLQGKNADMIALIDLLAGLLPVAAHTTEDRRLSA